MEHGITLGNVKIRQAEIENSTPLSPHFFFVVIPKLAQVPQERERERGMKMKERGFRRGTITKRKKCCSLVRIIPACLRSTVTAQYIGGGGGGRDLSISFAQVDARPNPPESPVRIVLSNLFPYSGFLLVRQDSRRGSTNERPNI